MPLRIVPLSAIEQAPEGYVYICRSIRCWGRGLFADEAVTACYRHADDSVQRNFQFVLDLVPDNAWVDSMLGHIHWDVEGVDTTYIRHWEEPDAEEKEEEAVSDIVLMNLSDIATEVRRVINLCNLFKQNKRVKEVRDNLIRVMDVLEEYE